MHRASAGWVDSARRARFALSLLLAGCGGGAKSGVGTTCVGNGSCQEGVCLPYPGGYCSADCTQAACPTGAVCLPRDGGHFCYAGCTSAGDCRSGYQCAARACVPACRTDGDCTLGYGCTAGTCAPLPGKPQGEACSADADCSSRHCDANTSRCEIACQREIDCPVAQTCFQNPVDTDGNGGTDTLDPVCRPQRAGRASPGTACATDGDCLLGQCAYGVCSTLCTGPSDCGAGQRCAGAFAWLQDDTPPLRECLPARGVLEVPVPDFALGVGVPEHAVSLGLWAAETQMDDSFYVGFTDLTDSDGNVLYANLTDFYNNTLRYGVSGGASFLELSNSPLVELRPGTVYTYGAFAEKASGGTTSTYSVTARIRVGDSPSPTSGKVSLHVFLTDLSGGCYPTVLTAANAHAHLGQFEQEVQTILGRAGLTVDEWRYFDTPAAPTVTLAAKNAPSPQLDALLATASAGEPSGVLQLVLVRHIDAVGEMPGWEVLGVAGGVPGSSGIPGTIHSGAAVSLTPLCTGGQGQLAITAAHELGHCLGLFHVVEQDGHTDQIVDDDGDGEANLMYWSESSTEARVSPTQGRMVRRSAAVHD